MVHILWKHEWMPIFMFIKIYQDIFPLRIILPVSVNHWLLLCVGFVSKMLVGNIFFHDVGFWESSLFSTGFIMWQAAPSSEICRQALILVGTYTFVKPIKYTFMKIINRLEMVSANKIQCMEKHFIYQFN